MPNGIDDDDVHRAAGKFLVVLHGAPHGLAVALRLRGKPGLFQHWNEPRAHRVRAHRQHTERHALAVKQPARALDSVADRVAEVQQLAQAGLCLVLLHDGLFDPQRAFDHRVDVLIERVRFQKCEQLRVRRAGHFDGLGQPVCDLPGRQRFEYVRVNEHFFRLPEGADDVFHVLEVDGHFTADGGVYLRQDGGRNVVKINTPHKTGGDEARQIAHHAAADGDDAVRSVEVFLQHCFAELLVNREALAALAGRHRDDHGRGALSRDARGVLCGHAGVRHNQGLAVQVQQRSRLVQTAALQHNVIAARAEFHGNHHVCVLLCGQILQWLE